MCSNEVVLPYEEWVKAFTENHEPYEIVDILELSSEDLVEAFRYQIINEYKSSPGGG